MIKTNISGMVWKGANDQKVRKYDFTYDAVNRLTAANFGQYTTNGFSNSIVNYNVNNLTYDANGNIKTMNQYGLKSSGTSGIIDQLTYTYQTNSNKLASVADAAAVDSAEHLGDFQNGVNTGDDYAYDGNGNLTQDLNKNIGQIQYNYLNLPSVIRVTGKGSIYYTYDAGGNKLRKVTVDSTVLPARKTVTLYIGSSVYVNDTLQFFGTAEGRVRPKADSSRFVYDYFLKDHLGNVRMVITDDYNVSSPILEATNYYPFGLTMAGISDRAAGGIENRYKYNGIELDTSLGSDEYEATLRDLDPQTGRWWQVDPETEGQEMWSPYTSNNDNPILYKDPRGNEGEACCIGIWDAIKKSYGEAKALAVGALNAWGSDQVLGAGNKTAEEAGFTGDEAIFYNAGQTTGHGAAIITGGIESLAGGASEALSGGGSTPVSIPIAVHGYSTASTAIYRLLSGGTFNNQGGTENKTSRESYRNAKDRNGVPRSQQPDKTIKPGTKEGKAAGLDERNVRQDEFTNSYGQKAIIRKDKPANYRDGGKQGSHYNAGQNPKKQKDLNQHHNY